MAYSKTNWVDGTTPVNAANLQKIENELELLDGRMVPDPAGQDGKWLADVGGAMVWQTLPASGIQPPAGVVANESILYDGAAWQRWDPVSGTYNIATTGANVDATWPGGTAGAIIVFTTGGGGTWRSLAAPTLGPGTRVSIRNGGTAFTIKHATGTPFFYCRSGGDVILLPDEIIEFVFDGSNWVEVSRDQAIPSGIAYIPVEMRNPQQTSGGVYPMIYALTAYERWYLEFANAACKIWGQFAVPPNVTPVAANQRIIFDLVAALTTGAARFNVKTRMVADGESTNPASVLTVTSQDITVPATAHLKKRVTFTISGENWRAGDTVIVEIEREGAHANDTLAGVCGILGVYARIA